jgi:hypothetical protein
MSGQHTASVGNYSLQSCCCYMAKSMGSRWGSLGYPSCILVNDIRKPPIKILRLAQVRLATLASSTERNGLRPRPDQGSRLKFQGRSSKLWPQMAQLAKKNGVAKLFLRISNLPPKQRLWNVLNLFGSGAPGSGEDSQVLHPALSPKPPQNASGQSFGSTSKRRSLELSQSIHTNIIMKNN